MADTSNGNESDQSEEETPEPPEPAGEPTEPLPTSRMSFPNQLNALRAYAAASGSAKKPVTVSEAGELANVTSSTLSLNNNFFASIGLLHKTDGKYTPSSEVVSYHRACSWDESTAARKLAPALRDSWFGEAILPRLTLGSMEESEAIQVLAEAANATPQYKNQLQMCLDYLESADLIERDNSVIKQGPEAAQSHQPEPQTTSAPKSRQVDREPDNSSEPSVATMFEKQTEGAVQFHVDVRVDMDELEGWKPDRIAAFFNGIAAVLSAKRGVEQGETDGIGK